VSEALDWHTGNLEAATAMKDGPSHRGKPDLPPSAAKSNFPVLRPRRKSTIMNAHIVGAKLSTQKKNFDLRCHFLVPVEWLVAILHEIPRCCLETQPL
jgi:hypothetical protein